MDGVRPGDDVLLPAAAVAAPVARPSRATPCAATEEVVGSVLSSTDPPVAPPVEACSPPLVTGDGP